ncbi:MAG: tetratricopeptide repeat protein [Fimbriimonadales bacterium]|nr:tetratricopeptide repeat protein [Fimbriimonadales bacterium]
MMATLLTLFLATVAGPSASLAPSDIKIHCSLQNEDRLSGVVEIRVTVEAEATVTQVEFYINGQLRHTDRSTPYTFLLDTLPEPEGPFTLEIAAYTAEGESQRLKLNLVIDNNLDKGAEFHNQSAIRFLNMSKWDEAIRAARIALKADANYVPAKVTLGRAYFGKGVLDEAQHWAEEALLASDTPEVRELLSGIMVERAFRLIAAKGERGDALKETSAALRAAVSHKHAAIDLKLKAAGPVKDENRLYIADLLIQKGEYSAARRILFEKWNQFEPDNKIANRLIYAAMRSGRMTEAYNVATAVQKRGAPDATTWALLAAGHSYYRRWVDAKEALRNGTLADPDSAILKTAAAYLALRQNDRTAMASQVNALLQSSETTAETYYYLAVLQWTLGMHEASRENYKKAIVQNPLLYDAYIQRGHEALYAAQRAQADPQLAKDKDLLLEQAREYMETALAAKPDSAEALNGLAFVYLYQGKYPEAVRMARAATEAGPEYPWAHFTYAAALSANRQSLEAKKAVDRAGELDKPMLAGHQIPTPDQAWMYTLRQGHLPVLIPPR